MTDLMFAADHGQLFFRWAHFLAALVWVGMTFALAWVHGPATRALGAAERPPSEWQALPRALYWVRWGAAWAWFTGVCLLFVTYYVGGRGLYFAGGSLEGAYDPTPAQWGLPFAALFLGFAVYDLLARACAGRGVWLEAAGFAAWLACAVGYFAWLTLAQHVSLRAGYVHVGALLGTVMAGNVWVRVWPAERRRIPRTADPDVDTPRTRAVVAQRLRDNGAMAVAAAFLMISGDQGRYGAADGARSSAVALAWILAVSWGANAVLTWRAGRVEGYRP